MPAKGLHRHTIREDGNMRRGKVLLIKKEICITLKQNTIHFFQSNQLIFLDKSYQFHFEL